MDEEIVIVPPEDLEVAVRAELRDIEVLGEVRVIEVPSDGNPGQ